MRTRELALSLMLVTGVAVADTDRRTANDRGAGGESPRVAAHEREVSTAATRALDEQLGIIEKTERLLIANVAERERQLRTRLRAAYRALRTRAPTPPWVDDDGARARARLRPGIRRVLTRERQELELVRSELSHAGLARQHVNEIRARSVTIAELAPRSLRNPIAYSRILASFGSYRHDPSKAQLSRRGIVLSSLVGRNVRAVADGRVRFVGDIRGLGRSVLVEHGDYWSLSGPLQSVAVSADRDVARADIIGESATETVYFEIRMATGGAGVPVDPRPLIAW